MPTLRSTSILLSVFAIGLACGAGIVSIDAASRGSAIFPDVTSGAYYDDAVGEMNMLGVINGYENGRFGPNDYVTRGQIAVLMKRLRDELKGISSSSRSSSSRSSSSRSSSSRSSSSRSSTANAGPEGAIEFSRDEIEIVESVRNVSIGVTRYDGTAGAVSVKYTVTDGTAVAGEDFNGTTGTLNFGNDEDTKLISLTLINDKVGEPTEDFTITLSDPTNGAVLGERKTVTVKILDNDGGVDDGSSSSSSTAATGDSSGGFSFAAKEYSVNENVGSITVRVVRTKNTNTSASVKYDVAKGSASNSEFGATNGTLNFSSGETEKSFNVSINDDSSVDGSKTVNLTLSEPSEGAELGAVSASTIIIVDDDMSAFTTGTGSFRFEKSSVTVGENAGNAVISVFRISGHEGTASINYATGGGSALSGDDYTAVSGTLTFVQGETKKVFLVPIVDDNTPNENLETVSISLSSPTNGATLGSPSTMTLNISE